MKQHLFVSIMAALLAACTTVGPDYERPAVNLPNEYRVAAGAPDAAPLAEEWWKLYSDATLDELIGAARTSNADMRLAIARVNEAEGLLREASGAYYPELTGSATGTRSRVSNVVIPPPQPGIPVNRSHYQLSASTSFELDFWGKFARASEAARANLATTQLSRDVVSLTLAGSTAQA
ncbi:MAG: TolC family protein, partial [Burkholderiales bacterium]